MDIADTRDGSIARITPGHRPDAPLAHGRVSQRERRYCPTSQGRGATHWPFRTKPVAMLGCSEVMPAEVPDSGDAWLPLHHDLGKRGTSQPGVESSFGLKIMIILACGHYTNSQLWDIKLTHARPKVFWKAQFVVRTKGLPTSQASLPKAQPVAQVAHEVLRQIFYCTSSNRNCKTMQNQNEPNRKPSNVPRLFAPWAPWAFCTCFCDLVPMIRDSS